MQRPERWRAKINGVRDVAAVSNRSPPLAAALWLRFPTAVRNRGFQPRRHFRLAAGSHQNGLRQNATATSGSIHQHAGLLRVLHQVLKLPPAAVRIGEFAGQFRHGDSRKESRKLLLTAWFTFTGNEPVPASAFFGQRFGSGDGERKVSMTRQMPYEPLPASVFLGHG